MNILKKLFSSARLLSPQTPLERPYLKPIQILELGGSRNGTSYLGAFTGQDDQKYMIGFPRPIGSNPAVPELRIFGTEESIRITGEELSVISSELRRLTSRTGQSLDSYAAEYLDVLEAIASSQSGSSPAHLESQEGACETPWFILCSRYGGDTRDPSINELRSALTDVFVENQPGMTLADYEEHPCASVRYGTDAGPMYLLSCGRSRSMMLEQWSDQDFGEELAVALTIESVSMDEALAIWSQLRLGQIEALRNEFERRGK